MRLAFLLYPYTPYGGLQRDLRNLVLELGQRGHQCRVYRSAWQGAALEGVEVRRVPARAFSKHRRSQRFHTWVRADLDGDPGDVGVIGFNAMPGLDIFTRTSTPSPGRDAARARWTFSAHAGFRHCAAWGRAVFAPTVRPTYRPCRPRPAGTYERHYHTPPQRLHMLPAGVTVDRRAPPDAPEPPQGSARGPRY